MGRGRKTEQKGKTIYCGVVTCCRCGKSFIRQDTGNNSDRKIKLTLRLHYKVCEGTSETFNIEEATTKGELILKGQDSSQAGKRQSRAFINFMELTNNNELKRSKIDAK